MIAVSKIKITIKNYKVMTKNGVQSRQIPMKEIVLIEVVGLQVTTFLNVHCLTGIFQGFFFIFRNTSSTRHSQWLLAYFISIFRFSRFLNGSYFKHIEIYRDQVENALNFLFSKYFSPFHTCPADNYLFKFNNRSTRTRREICPKLTVKTLEWRHWHHSGVFIINFENISHLVLGFLSLTLNR